MTPFSLPGGEDADLGLIAETIFSGGSGGPGPDLDMQLELIGSRILILNSVRLAAERRGFGLGVLLAGTAIKKLSSGVRAAVGNPAPIDDLTSGHPDTQHGGLAERQKAVSAPGRVWARLGFEHFRNGIHVLDLNLTALDETTAMPARLRPAATAVRCAAEAAAVPNAPTAAAGGCSAWRSGVSGQWSRPALRGKGGLVAGWPGML